MGQPCSLSYLCRVLFARAPVSGLCFFVSVSALLIANYNSKTAITMAPPALQGLPSENRF